MATSGKEPAVEAVEAADPAAGDEAADLKRHLFALKQEFDSWDKIKGGLGKLVFSEFQECLGAWLLHSFANDEYYLGNHLMVKLTVGLAGADEIAWKDVVEVWEEPDATPEPRVSMSSDVCIPEVDEEGDDGSGIGSGAGSGSGVAPNQPVAGDDSGFDSSPSSNPGGGYQTPNRIVAPRLTKTVETTFAETHPDFALDKGTGRRRPSILSSRISGGGADGSQDLVDRFRHSTKLGEKVKARVLRRVLSHDANSSNTGENTLTDPDQEEALRSLALALLLRIQHSSKFSGPLKNKELVSASSLDVELMDGSIIVVDPNVIYRFIANIFVKGELRLECLISCLVYIDRLCTTDEDAKGRYVKMDQRNWKALVTAALVIASKVWDDESLINEDFSILTQFSLEQINTWEQEILYFVKFDVQIASKEYAEYYFSMRTLHSKYRKLFGRIQSTEMKPLKKITDLAKLNRRNSGMI